MLTHAHWPSAVKVKEGGMEAVGLGVTMVSPQEMKKLAWAPSENIIERSTSVKNNSKKIFLPEVNSTMARRAAAGQEVESWFIRAMVD